MTLLGAAFVLAAAALASAANVEVHIHNATFTPATVNVHPADTVTFFNDDGFDHDVTFEAGFGSGATASLHAGTNWSHTFATAGTFRFRCTVHSTSFDTGMVGSVVVTTPGATITVHILNAAFSPATVNIHNNDTVVFINDDSFDHDVLFEAGFGSGAAASLHAGANWSHTFTTYGTFKFRCQTHSTNFDTGMVGKVVNPDPNAPPPPPPKSPGFELPAAIAAIGAVAFIAARRRSA